ncbi:hypothetical protein RLQ69_001332 [Campylobacter jejuni]|uniref:Uncharacterized protein n=2 Tax=Campylobacter jejuni TaxID=197 RepID=A0A690V5G0_CAMJU|nr:hypothetical protein [Campylobacter jejuni]EAJ5194303.1 hypothetical protein [Campylobacter jejuni]EAK0573848.1 hypothetical protein [Campylobacter jejuni]EDP7702344.1 hypothetical protein [Campylobacter jejuni]EDP8234651.1 hypothetical protein [Campylobacter jejuni]EFV4334021.1 hypothetical protein [Campylobacter jejuni]
MLNLKSLEITCKECQSEFSMFIGHSLYVCPICGNNFGINELNDPFFRNYDIELVCEIKD